MDSIDFNSWDEKEDNKNKTKLNEFDKKSFEHYLEQVEKAKKICEPFVADYKEFIKICEQPETDSKKFITGMLNVLFKVKLNRLEARQHFEPNDIKNKFIEGAKTLQLVLNCIPLKCLQKPSNGDRKKDYDLLLILLYNDLSICYSGLQKSSLSRGYAEQSIELIKEDKDYPDFQEKIEGNSRAAPEENKISELPFVSGEKKLFDLYTYALFCKGVAESRSSQKEEAEKTFNQILKFTNKTGCRKSDYFSTCINLAVLLIDLGRGKEAIQMLEMDGQKDKMDKMDRRLAESIIEKASALIDQSCYIEARGTLDKLFEGEGSRNESLSEPILNGQIYYGRSYLEEARNVVKDRDNNLNEAERELKNALEHSEKREQKNLIQKTAKYLGEVHKERGKTGDALNFYTRSLTEGDVTEFHLLLEKDWTNFVKDCNDTPLLENFAEICYKNLNYSNTADKKNSLCLDLLKKLKEEYKEKENRLDLERAERKIEEIELMQQGNSADIHPETLKEDNFPKCFNKLIDRKNTDDCPKEKLRFCSQLLSASLIYDRLSSNERTFDNALFGRTISKIEDNSLAELIVLRRWNSFSPGLSRRSAVSLGGGYLLRIRKPEDKDDPWFNIVIDPGNNFLLNFHSENFKVQDIDAVVVTHSHSDHCAELSEIMVLMHQINKRRKKFEKTKENKGNNNTKRVYLLLSKGAYKKFSPYIPDWKEQLKDVVLLEDENKWNIELGFEIKAIETAHADLGGVRAIGVLVAIKEFLIGFTGDTPWRKKIQEKFKDCDLLCLHMGGIKEWEIGYNENNEKISDNACFEKIKANSRGANHLLFFGSKDIIDKCKKPGALVIVGEFGEELKYGLRTDLVEKLTPECGSPLCIPADTGLYLTITDTKDKKIRCEFCGRFVPHTEIRVFAYGIVDSLHYICEACHLTLNESQKRTIVESALTRH